MATALTLIAEYLEAVAALEGKHEYRATFGKRFHGLATETEAGLAVADWASRVRAELAGVDEITFGARRTLLSGDQDRLQALAAFGRGPAFAALGEHFGRLPDLSASLDAIALVLEARAVAVDALAATCDRYGVPGPTCATALPDLCRLMRAAHAAQIAARIPGALATALGELAPRPLDDHGPLRAALTLAAVVDDLPVCDEIRRNLQDMGPSEIQTVVKPAVETMATPSSFRLHPSFLNSMAGRTMTRARRNRWMQKSILDLTQAVFRPMRQLRWHYRSRHGSLVAFSNREFYDDDLIVFPSPAEADPTQGVTTTKVDGIYKSRSNIAEVTAVCAAAIEHMRRRPGRSLGIATLNQVQRDLIVQEMDRLATVHPHVEEYRKRWSETLERFFIKNLENVQGDERDVIFVSTVFGPSEPGGKVKQVFGPINGATGHRRLNVSFTRAKHHVRVFTSMTPDDVLAGPDSPRGAQVLKAYLAYAATGRLDAGMETGREADSDFEVFVRDRLRLAGYEAIPQVGVAGFFIDLGVRDPDVPGSFMLGIECDGASYHSSKSARDRDILRQKILEGLGWNIYRIWSTDWFRDPAGQTKKLIGFMENLRRRKAQTRIT